MRASLVNVAWAPGALDTPSLAAAEFHAGLPAYRPTPLRTLPALAAELGVEAISVKDESDRFGLPAFKVLGASWAIERALRQRADVRTLVAASAGNHGRAVARVAACRGLGCRIFLPAHSAAARREAITSEGAHVHVVDGGYDDAVAEASAAATEPGVQLIADVGDDGPARWVIDGYATLFDEAAAQGRHDVILVPVGVGSLGAAAARFAAGHGTRVIGVEPEAAACLTASLAAGRPVAVPTPGTTMAGLDCANVSPAAWPALSAGIRGTVAVSDAEAAMAMRRLAAEGLRIGESGAAPLAGLTALLTDPSCAPLREAAAIGAGTRVLLIATEGPTDPDSYARAVSS